MLVEHGETIGEASDFSRAWREIAADQVKQGGLAGAIGAANGDAFGAADRERQRAEQAAVAMRHYHVLEGDEFAAAGQAGLWQFDRQRRQDFHSSTGFR